MLVIICETLYLYDRNRKYNKLEELAAFSCINHFFLIKDLEKNKIEQAIKNSQKTIEIVRAIKKEQGFSGKYWRDFDYYVEGISK
jgi:hypothetical protein